MIDRVHPAGKRVLCVRIPLHLVFEVPVPDLGEYQKVRCFSIDIDLIIIVAEDEGGVGEKPGIIYMIPAQGTGRISPVDAGEVFLAKYIPSEITRQIQPVFFAENEIDLGVQVVEIKPGIAQCAVFGQL